MFTVGREQSLVGVPGTHITQLAELILVQLGGHVDIDEGVLVVVCPSSASSINGTCMG